jgi:hypothetical protein
MLKLNEAQLTSVTVELRKLLSTCDEIERLLTATSNTRLVRIENEFSEQERGQIMARIDAIRRYVEELAETWGLAPNVVNVRRHLLGMLNLEWVDLTDTRPDALRRSGVVDPEAAAELRPAMDHLIDEVEHLLDLCKRSQWRVKQ